MPETPKTPPRIQPPAPPPSTTPPVRPRGPVPVPPATPAAGAEDKAKPDPTRFGDWEKNGRCIDF